MSRHAFAARSLILLTAMAGGLTAHAEIIAVGGAPYPAPTTLGPYEMTLFPEDPRPLWEYVFSVPGPFGEDLVFSDPLEHVWPGMGGGIWPGWLSPDMYASGLSLDEVTLYLPPGAVAFDYWAKTIGDAESVTATADGETSLTQELYGFQATYFGFYATEPGETIETITIEWAFSGIYLGHFQIAVPEPGSFALLFVLGGAALGLRRR